MLKLRRRTVIETPRLTLRLPQQADHMAWSALRQASKAFLTPWEPVWAEDHLSRRSFTNRVSWALRSDAEGSGLPLFVIRREDQMLMGGITLDYIRRGPAQSGTIGYWMGEPFTRHGYMREAIEALSHHAFTRLDLSRIEAACLPENTPSRALLEKCGFKYEGVAQAYLQIAGRWRNHVLYSLLRHDRRGRVLPG